MLRKYTISALTSIMILINGLGASGKLGFSMTQLNSVFTFGYMPPAIAFMISWGLVYLLQCLYLYTIFRDKNDIDTHEFTLNCILIIANIFWMIFTTQKNFIIPGILIIIMWVCLVLLNKKFFLKKNTKKQLIFGIYLGWVTTATFGITLGQFLFMANEAFAKGETGAHLVFFAGIVGNIATYLSTKNTIALTWGLLALLSMVLRFYGIV